MNLHIAAHLAPDFCGSDAQRIVDTLSLRCSNPMQAVLLREVQGYIK